MQRSDTHGRRRQTRRDTQHAARNRTHKGPSQSSVLSASVSLRLTVLCKSRSCKTWSLSFFKWIKITDFDAGVSPFQLAKLQLEGFSIGPWILRQDREETAARCPLPLKEEVRAIANLAAKETSVDDAVSRRSFDQNWTVFPCFPTCERLRRDFPDSSAEQLQSSDFTHANKPDWSA